VEAAVALAASGDTKMSPTSTLSDLENEARQLVERLGGRWTGNGGLCLCPAHDDRTPSLSVRPGRTRLLLHCFAGCDAVEILRSLSSARLLEPGAPGTHDFAQNARNTPDLQAAALRLWGSARAIVGTPAELYLSRRGLRAESDELRFLARTPDGPKPLTRFRPALIAAVRDCRGLVGVHRTFLNLEPAGGAKVHARSGLGRFGRGAVRLGIPGSKLGLAEGIETALSASDLFGVPCWATLGTERFALVSVPPSVTELLLFLDNDPGGRRAEALARLANPHIPSIEPFYPDGAGDDWNDVLMASAAGDGRERRGGG
jgi:putative DNA primase/helicase